MTTTAEQATADPITADPSTHRSGPPPGADEVRAYWRRVLAAGGFTPIPRWTLHPVPGVARYEAAVAVPLASAVRDLAADLGVPSSAILLAAHAKVLAALSGEADVTTGRVTDGRPLPCRVATDTGSWRELVLEAARAEADVLAHRDVDLDALRQELGRAEAAFETELAVHPDEDDAGDGELAGPTVLRVTMTDDAGSLVLHYRTDAIDDACARRIAGYHRTALEQVVADPDAAHARRTLLSPDELDLQLEGLAGPRRTLPDRRFHELFEEQVRARPDDVAISCGDAAWTYAELNRRANRIGRALLARGLEREGVVAVVTERTLDWAAAVLAVFKAGGVYLPIEPHFPADRIARTLARAGCHLVVTEKGSTDTLREALGILPGVRTLFVDDAAAEPHPDDDLGIEVGADQLAYIYFTSGSTGEPKGAMCEHAGMVNHLFAKIDDLGIRAGDVVAQVAPQCFDISLWQLVSALAVGGRTLIVEQEVILDVARFVDTVDRGRVAVLQVVPSYLEAVLTYLEQHPRDLPDLRVVSATGEALKKELTERWFAVRPGVALVNAYGLTETSDDTNHAVLHEPPAGDRVPLGPCVNNVHVYVVDEQLNPVPLGAPGLIVFSGVCVGRGYVNDPERTAQHYLTDPHRPGNRLYRGGDYGRWMPDRTLEFLGRKDNQVKISGFRIEIGEIENTLLRVPGVRDACVVVAERPDRSRRLVAFYAAPQPVEVDVLRGTLAESLPAYMVPAVFHPAQALPLTANSKIDRKALTARATELETADTSAADSGFEAPATPTERRLADAWATVLGVSADQIGRRDHFFDRGGTSLAAVKLAIALKRAVSLKDLTRTPVLADLAALVDSRSRPQRQGLLHSLSDPEDARRGTLVCFPYAGGNAVNYQQLAKALRGVGPAVVAVELPGHDLTAEREAFAPLPDVVAQVVDEVAALAPDSVHIWGHSAGAAFAVATARALADRGIDVRRVFLAAQLPGSATDRRAAADRLEARDAAALAAELAADSGYTELGELDAARAEHVGAAYRHDCVSAHRYLADLLDTSNLRRLTAPVTVVVAADDPSTAGRPEGYRAWEQLAEHVDAHELPDGGHYFLRSRAAAAAQVVLRGVGLAP